MTDEFKYKFGKKPARHGAIKLKFADFIDRGVLRKTLPEHPKGPFGHETIIKPGDWGMLGNDNAGDCVWAGAAHETKMIAGMGGHQVWFSDKNVLKDYSDTTGYVPGKEDTDNGTDMQAAAKYRQNVGILDGHGKRHKIIAYAGIDPGNVEDHLIALYVLGAVGVGIQVPSYMPKQFDAGQPFDVRIGRAKIVGGHYLPLVARRAELMVVTWAKVAPMTERFLERFNDESVAYLTDEGMKNQRSPEGFDYQGMLDAMNALKGHVK